ncbi:MAG: NTP transferase domain-containing protein [Candidatus Pacebacteria bacterium]|jgi:glucose-1-phosphate thymidylyltransferase|nr:NTP transferase domain-containing protein [Candidatus Paceibacterota bacterium]MBT4652358.1 NTP transferase domain-containing protein [Candidatus Paceibacterota bacterium]MBT6756185.1 NTP transferase domain-containing protein [Candidatus Paceibacterota bacterium]MBT6921476.1 NTP transferase domain-containing protein [Candidatus Paceibacterota bacterium]
MKGVILAGGLGTRLYPLTHVTNKHLLPVYNKPMVFYPIKTLVDAGIDEILIVTSGPHVGHFLSVLKNGKELGAKHLEYAYQEKPNGGIADALALAEDFADGEDIAVILGDNTTDESIKEAVTSFKEGATVFLKKVTDPERFGVPAFDPKDNSKVIRIDEKPKNPASEYAVTGVYLYDNKIFDMIRECDPNYAGRGELEITQVNNLYIDKGQLHWKELEGFWSDAGTFQSLFTSSEYWSKKK